MSREWWDLPFGTSAWFGASSQSAGAALVGRLQELTGELPDVNLRDRGVQVRFRGPVDAVTTQAVSTAALDLDLLPDPAALQALQVRIDAVDESVVPFWRAVLGYEARDAGGLADPLRRDPGFTFGRLDEERPLRNRVHVDVVRPWTLTAARETAAGAGGREAFAGDYYSTVADAEGNEVDIVGGADFEDAADWRGLFGGMTFYPTTSPAVTVDLVTAVAGLVDESGLPLMVDVRPDGVALDTGKDLWEDDRFADLARRTQAAAHDLGLTADPSRLRFVQFGIDAVDVAAVRAFWQEVLGYAADTRQHVTDIYDPRWLNPPLFFQQMDAADEARRRQRNRIRFELVVPSDRFEDRLGAAVAIGGRVVRQQPGRTTVADPENNELDLVAGRV
ncbi:VOC family protein [Kribbella sp. NPDC050124]|uniref:VOC family protein n=1 Tax=Kribbella sp. NPDC050124 TaxID=3364114 RepID=UPI0037B3F461